MKAKLQKRLLPGVVITLLTVSTVFSGATAKGNRIGSGQHGIPGDALKRRRFQYRG